MYESLQLLNSGSLHTPGARVMQHGLLLPCHIHLPALSCVTQELQHCTDAAGSLNHRGHVNLHLAAGVGNRSWKREREPRDQQEEQWEEQCLDQKSEGYELTSLRLDAACELPLGQPCVRSLGFSPANIYTREYWVLLSSIGWLVCKALKGSGSSMSRSRSMKRGMQIAWCIFT